MADRTVPFPYAKVFYIFVEMTAYVADLGRGKITADFEDRLAIPACFVGKHPDELAPRNVADRLAEAPCADHVFDSKIFDTEHIVVFDEQDTDLVFKVTAAVAQFLIEACDTQFLFLVVAAFTQRTLEDRDGRTVDIDVAGDVGIALAGKGALGSGNAFFQGNKIAGIGDLHAIGKRKKVMEAKIDTDC